MAWWTSLYLCIFNGAILLGKLTASLQLHPFFVVVFFGAAIALWLYWHNNYGEVHTTNKEYGLKIGILGVMLVGWLLGVNG